VANGFPQMTQITPRILDLEPETKKQKPTSGSLPGAGTRTWLGVWDRGQVGIDREDVAVVHIS
jgi:hypothetical protein